MSGCSFIRLGPLLLLVGCAHASTASTEGWQAASSEYFRVYAPGGYARPAAVRLENLRRELARQFPPTKGPTQPIEVLVLPSMDDIGAIRKGAVGLTRYSDDGLVILMSVEAIAAAEMFEQVVAHELTHYLSAYAVRHQPRWLSDGLAGVLETLLIGENGGVAVGRALPWRVASLRQTLMNSDWGVDHRGKTLEWLWGWSEPGFDDADSDQAYSLSWAWMHLLINRHPQQLQAFYAGLNRAVPARQAFSEAFSTVPVASLERELVSHLLGDLPVQNRSAVSRSVPVVTSRALRPAEALLARARLLAWGSNPDGQVLSQVVRLEPKLHEARWLQIESLPTPSERSEAGRRFIAVDDSDEGWARLAAMLLDDPASDSRLVYRAISRAAQLRNDPRAQASAALGYHYLGDWASAREHVERALTLAPWSLRSHFIAAQIFSATGDCGGAELEKASVLESLRAYHDDRVVKQTAATLATITCPGAARRPVLPREVFNPLLDR